MILEYLSGPVVGAVIGYITNDIAIRMLFRPRQSKHIFGWHVPFTPGIIPKEKNRIAGAIGTSISENLMNRDVLERNLLSDEMIAKVRQAVADFAYTQLHNDETVEQFARHYLTTDEVKVLRDNAITEATKLLITKLQDSAVGEQIAHVATEHVIEKTRHSLAGKLGADKLLSALSGPVKSHLAKHINEVLRSQSGDMVSRLVSDEGDKLLSLPMRRLLAGHEEQVKQAQDSIVSVYRTVITEHLPRILEAIDISAIVESRIREMDIVEAETIIMQLIRKELRAIVWLGALLGCIMGTVTTLINS
ncbi:MAG: DUF445 family protein [Muribaculaceae bacterium]|nr:DUF445 family protein [Muribaculaceae bacterium]